MNVRRTLRWIPALFVLCACGGGGGGGGGDPGPGPNSAPVLTVPGTLGGSSPSYQLVLAAGSSTTLTFTATDPEGDPLLWQLGVPGAQGNAAGLQFTTPVTGSTFELQVAAVTSPAAAPVTLLVEDPRGAAAAIDLLVVRSGAPAITNVVPDSSFQALPQRVTVTGAGLQLGGFVNTSVAFDGFAVTQSSVSVVDDTTLTCLTPTAVPPGPTVVAVGNQFGTASLPGSEFTVFAFPPVFATADQRLDAATVTGFHLATDGSTVHAVWHEGTTVVHKKSTDGGTVWSAALPISGPEAASEPRVVADGDDVGVAWIGDNNAVWFARSTDGGTSFLLPQRLDDPAAPAAQTRRPRLCQVGARRYVAWLEGDTLAGTSRVVAIASADLGATWASRQKISDVANQDNHDVRCAGEAAWVVMEDERLGPSVRGVYVVHTPNSGTNWAAAQRLNTQGTAASSPRAGNAGNRAHVAWLQNDALLHLGSIDGGATWGNNITTVQDALGGAVSAPALAADTTRVCFAYTIGGTAVWSARIPTPTSPVQRTQVDSLVTPSSATSIELDGNYAYVAWLEGTAGSERVRVAVSGDGAATFASNAPFGDAVAQQQSPQLVHQGARLILGWLESRSGAVGVFTNRVQ